MHIAPVIYLDKEHRISVILLFKNVKKLHAKRSDLFPESITAEPTRFSP